jgi:carbonic anhydrase/acetyltransferase-like protein (isoleucine patch superfamily)
MEASDILQALQALQIGKKYELLPRETINPHHSGFTPRQAHRIRALQDIPKHGVKRGDIGGYVTDEKILSHEGACWIGENAQVLHYVKVTDDAYIGGSALVASVFVEDGITISGNVHISDEAKVYTSFKKSKRDLPTPMVISDNVRITGEAEVFGVLFLTGNASIYENAFLNNCAEIGMESQVFGQAIVGPGVKVIGKSKVYGDSLIRQDAVIQDSEVKAYSIVPEGTYLLRGQVSSKKFQAPAPKPVSEVKASSKNNEIAKANTRRREQNSYALESFDEVKSEIASYETDIVKIIKYPVMTDRTDPHTLKMIMALKKANRLAQRSWDPRFENAVTLLEEAFLTAESNALKLASTRLSKEDLKKTERAKDLLAIAADEGSAENEKRVSFKQAFKQLEGIIVVPEIAIDTFRIKVGLKELES